VNNNIAEIEQGANEALSENRRELAEESAKINREPDLSEEAKARYVGEARERAQAKYVQIIDGHEKAIAERLEQNEKRLFSLSYPKDVLTDSQKETFRASYRQATLQLLDASEEAVSRMMTRAFRTGDTVLAQAAYHESIERGLSEVGDEYRERYPDAREVWDVYIKDRRAAESREHILAGALLKSQDAWVS
jgi:hypothetical protein